MRGSATFVLVALVASLLAGCIQPMPAQEAQQNVTVAESALCSSIEAYSASVAALEGVTADTTVDEFKQLQQAEADAYEAMVDSWVDLQEAEVQEVQSAVNDFQNTLRSVSGEDTLGEVATNIQEGAATVRASVDQLDQKACAPTTPSN